MKASKNSRSTQNAPSPAQKAQVDAEAERIAMEEMDAAAAAERDSRGGKSSDDAPVGVRKLGRPMTDQGNAERLTDQHGKVLRFVEDRGDWRAWQGTHWKHGDKGTVYRCAVDTARSIHDEADLVTDAIDKKYGSLRDRMHAFACLTESKSSITAMINLGSHVRPISCLAAAFDTDPWLLCTPSCTVDLRAGGKILKSMPEMMISRRTRGRIATVPEQSDRCPVWTAFLEQIFCGDHELRDWVQRAVGLSLLGLQLEHVFFFCWGDGANGKSTFLNALLYALGDYGAALPPDLLIEKKFAAHPTELADLEGRRMAVGSEVPKGSSWDEVRIKALSGGDPIKARKMRQDFYEFNASHTLWVSGNDKPHIKGTDKGIWRRVRLIPFLANIALADLDRNLPKKLELEVDGILAWAVEGCRAYVANGLGSCAAVDRATQAYREEEDLLGQFFNEECEFNPSDAMGKKEMRDAIRRWFGDRDIKMPSDQDIHKRLADRTVVAGQTHHGARVWRGVRLRNAPNTEDQTELPLRD